ncbi:MAG: transcription antitermination factor NusB [Firmicutes bacterium]|nr:transcription antitermination factor NusB [Bacillota bacterium]
MSRRQGREAALKTLFQVGLGGAQPDFALEQLILEDGLTEDAARFARRLIDGVLAEQPEVDRILAQLSIDWSLKRMANIDRTLLRLAVYELLFCPDIPVSVAINEAVELAKLYSTQQSSRFVNGILSSVAKRKFIRDGKNDCNK